jgi:hypothetical protein
MKERLIGGVLRRVPRDSQRGKHANKSPTPAVSERQADSKSYTIKLPSLLPIECVTLSKTKSLSLQGLHR